LFFNFFLVNIYVGNLSWSMTNEDLAALFQQYGSVSSAKILTDKFTGRSKGFGFVEMDNADEANAAIGALNDSEIQGRKIVVNEAQPKPEGGGGFKKRSFGGGGGGGGFRRGGSGGGFNRGGGGGGYNRDY
jgi:RNA recognition motif-containing protein